MAAPDDAVQQPIRWRDDDYVVLTFAVPAALAARLQKQADIDGDDAFDIARDALEHHLDEAEAKRGAFVATAAIAPVSAQRVTADEAVRS